jgi:hypothetical protein
MNDTEVTRTVQMEDRTIHIHIHLTGDEVRRLLLPHLVEYFASEIKRQAAYRTDIRSSGATGSMLL